MARAGKVKVGRQRVQDTEPAWSPMTENESCGGTGYVSEGLLPLALQAGQPAARLPLCPAQWVLPRLSLGKHQALRQEMVGGMVWAYP